MDNSDLNGKKLLILGGNPETVQLVELANSLGIKTIVSSARKSDPAKSIAWKTHDYAGLDTSEWVSFAKKEQIDGVLVGVADILVPAYGKICKELGFPCYTSDRISDCLAIKDEFKKICAEFEIDGIPAYDFDDKGNYLGQLEVDYPLMVKPVDNGGGVGMTPVYYKEDMPAAISKALQHSKRKRFIVERLMDCDDVCMYYSFKDGDCSLSCMFDRYTTRLQKEFGRVNTLSIYPSKYVKEYLLNYHSKFEKMFHHLGIRDGVLAISAFVENGRFYVYDPGFRFQGEAPHLLLKEIFGYDQREMLIRYALTGSQGDIDIKKIDSPDFNGKFAATLWFLLKDGTIGSIKGMDDIETLPHVYYNKQRLHEGDTVTKESVGTERQVLTRLYIICDSAKDLAKTIKYCINGVKVFDTDGNNMIVPFEEAKGYIEGVMDEP